MWFASFRGSVYSSHVDLTEKDPDYWDYSFDEFALFDIPTVIEYVIKATNYQKVAVLAHSQGTLSMFGSLIFKSAELESKVSVYAALSPVFRVDHLAIAGIFKYFFLESNIFDILEKFGVYTIFRRNKVLSDALYGICAVTPKLCQWFVDLLCSSVVAPYDNLEAYKYLAYHMPNSFTIKNIRQFRQIYQSKGVYMYDFGIPENTRIYGTNKPPMYDISNIASIPIGLFREKYDRFTTEPDFIYLHDALKERGVLKYSSVYEGGHISMFTGKNTTIFIEAAAFISGYHSWNQSSNE
jgi:lysosomal acid lipase/cholesteryl ester hydrolase